MFLKKFFKVYNTPVGLVSLGLRKRQNNKTMSQIVSENLLNKFKRVDYSIDQILRCSQEFF